jgi:hypothetical protein
MGNAGCVLARVANIHVALLADHLAGLRIQRHFTSVQQRSISELARQ